MAFGHGKNMEVHVNGYDLTAYFESCESSHDADVAETSVFGGNNKAFVAGQKQATITLAGFYDGTAAAVDAVLQAAVGVDNSEFCVWPQGDTAGNYGQGFQGIQTAYSITGTVDDACRVSASVQSITGRERIVSLKALAQVTTSGSTTAIDNGASSANGGSAYLQVTDVTGTVEVKIEHSTDNNTWADLVEFTAVDTDHSSQRVTFSGTVNRYTRVTYTLGGGETLTFACGLHRT